VSSVPLLFFLDLVERFFRNYWCGRPMDDVRHTCLIRAAIGRRRQNRSFLVGFGEFLRVEISLRPRLRFVFISLAGHRDRRTTADADEQRVVCCRGISMSSFGFRAFFDRPRWNFHPPNRDGQFLAMFVKLIAPKTSVVMRGKPGGTGNPMGGHFRPEVRPFLPPRKSLAVDLAFGFGLARS